MMRFPIAALLIATLAACGSGGSARPADVARSEVGVRLGAPLFFGSGQVAPATFEVTVRNQATVPIRVWRIHLSSPSMVQYAIRPVERTFNDSLEPGESKSFALVTDAVASAPRLDSTEPMNVRVEIDLEANGHRYRELSNVMGVGQ